jgi:hypothetical protein
MKKNIIILAVSLLTSFAYSNNQTKFTNDLKDNKLPFYSCTQTASYTVETPIGTITRTVSVTRTGLSQLQACDIAQKAANAAAKSGAEAALKAFSQP